MPRFQIGDCLAFHPHLCRLVRPGEHAQVRASKTQAREQKPRQTADRSPARRGDVSDEHDASRPASLTFISPRIFGKREGTAHNIRALPRRARARRASAASPQRPARRLRHHGARRRPRAHPQPQGAAHSIQDDGRPPLAFVLPGAGRPGPSRTISLCADITRSRGRAHRVRPRA